MITAFGKEFIELITPLHHYIRVKGRCSPMNENSRVKNPFSMSKKNTQREREAKGKNRMFAKMHDSYQFHKLLMLPNLFANEILRIQTFQTNILHTGFTNFNLVVKLAKTKASLKYFTRH